MRQELDMLKKSQSGCSTTPKRPRKKIVKRVLSVSIANNNYNYALLGSTVVSPYVGMARKQNGGYNASISVQTLIFHLVVNSTRLKTVRSGRWCCPNYTMAPRLVENVVKVTNLEVVKIEFRHLPFLPSSFFLQPA